MDRLKKPGKTKAEGISQSHKSINQSKGDKTEKEMWNNWIITKSEKFNEVAKIYKYNKQR